MKDFLLGRTAGRKTAAPCSIPAPRRGPHFSWLMLPLLLSISLLAASCGVKNDLTKPDGTTTPRDTHDPSKPPYPIGR
jgi:hypothetical protein